MDYSPPVPRQLGPNPRQLAPYTKVPIMSRYVFCCTHVYCSQLNRRLQLITSTILQQALQLVYCKLKYYVELRYLYQFHDCKILTTSDFAIVKVLRQVDLLIDFTIVKYN